MKYVLVCLLLISISGIVFSKKKNYFKALLIAAIALELIMYPSPAISAAKDGINLWLFAVTPSLLPFFIINDLLVTMNVPDNISVLFAPVTRFLFRSSGYGSYCMIMSMFSGYPTGAKIVASLIKDKKISAAEGERILSFSSTSGPLFILGTVGSIMLKSPEAGYILLISHIIGAILNGVLYRLSHNDTSSSCLVQNKVSLASLPASKMFADAITNSFLTLMYIGGYVIFFSVILKLLDQINFFEFLLYPLQSLPFIKASFLSTVKVLLKGSLEMSNGCNLVSSSSLSLSTILILISFMLSFSGLSIIGQVSTVLQGTNINIKKYVIYKVYHGILSAASCFIILKLKIFPLYIPTVSGDFYPLFQLSNYKLLVLMLILILILNCLGFLKSRRYTKLHS